MKLFYTLACTYTFALSSVLSALPQGIEYIQTLDGIQEYRLSDNGLRVRLMPNPGLPVATVMVTYQVGARNEVTGTTGATPILEHMMFKGTKTTKPGEFSKIIAAAGGRENAFTGAD